MSFYESGELSISLIFGEIQFSCVVLAPVSDSQMSRKCLRTTRQREFSACLNAYCQRAFVGTGKFLRRNPNLITRESYRGVTLASIGKTFRLTWQKQLRVHICPYISCFWTCNLPVPRRLWESIGHTVARFSALCSREVYRLQFLIKAKDTLTEWK